MTKQREMNHRKWLWTAVTVLYVLFIFHNSATVAVESSRQSGRVLALAKECLAGLGVESGWLSEHLIRKTAPFLEYSLYGVLLWNCLGTYELRGKLRGVTFLWLAMLIPFVDETIQLFTEGRSGQISDVWLDMSGVLFGTCLMVGFGCFLTRWKKMAGKNCGTENRGINENDRISGKTFRKKL